MSSRYDLVTSALSEAEKKRIFCVWMNSQSVNIDWEKVVIDYGSGNVETFRKRNRETFLKVQNITAGGKPGTKESPPLTPESDIGSVEGASGKKRKAVAQKGRASKARRGGRAASKGAVKAESEGEGEAD